MSACNEYGDSGVVEWIETVAGCCGNPLSTGECCGNAVPTAERVYGPCPSCNGSGDRPVSL